MHDRYREPAWNDPVVRFVDARGEDLLPRFTHEGGTAGYAARMVEALQAANAPVPARLDLFVDRAEVARAMFDPKRTDLGGAFGTAGRSAGS